MTRRPRCFKCGRGLSQRWSVAACLSPEERLLLAIFAPLAIRGPVCAPCGRAALKEAQP